MQEAITKAREIVQLADAILITAGAGMGVDSGLPDFRGDKGFWKAYPPLAKLGISFSQMANPKWFDNDPALAWGFYGHRLDLYRKTIPHKGFTQLLEFAQQKAGGYFVYTSNVDGQFHKAGFDKQHICECHGSIHFAQCAKVCTDEVWNVDDLAIAIDLETFRAAEPLPYCKNCTAIARPNILMFGDWHWIAARADDQHKNLDNWLHHITVKGYKLAIIEIGAGRSVPTVRLFSQKTARNYGGTLIRINPVDFAVDAPGISLPFTGGEGIEVLTKF